MNHKAQLLDWDVLGQAIATLHEQKRWNELLTLACATYTGCRPGDWRLFTWSVFMDKNGVVKDEINILEAKKKAIAETAGRKAKKRQLFLNKKFRIILADAWVGLHKPDINRFIFTGTRGPVGNGISTNTANSRLKVLASEFDLPDTITTYSLRKTCARKIYDSHDDVMEGVGVTQRFLGHQSVASTMHYIGKTDDEARAAVEKLNF